MSCSDDMLVKPLRIPALLCLGSTLFLTPVALGQAEDEVPADLSASDWSSIRAAYEAHRHAVQPVDGGYQARNPGQGWRMRFDGRGFTVSPEAGEWTWGLELKATASRAASRK